MTETEEQLEQIHRRLDAVYGVLTPLASDIAEIRATCGPCKLQVESHQVALHGNGKWGIITEVATLKSGRTDTLSVKSVCVLVGTISSAWGAAIGAAMAAFAK